MKSHPQWLPLGLSASIAVVTLLAGCAAAPQRPASIARGDYAATQTYATQLIAHEMDKYKVPGLSIALVDDQRVVWAQGFGFADAEGKKPATADTLYRVASISKLFTDVAALQLAEQGRLDIDKPVQTYLPSFAPQSRFTPASPITPRQLMTHHAGLPRDQLKGFHTTTPQSLDEFTATLGSTFVTTPPNYAFSYSNLGLSVLGDVVQTVAAKPFAQHVQDAVLVPLGMRHAHFNTQPADSPLMAKGYRGRELVPEMPLRDVPAAGLSASVRDLSRFISMVFANGKTGVQAGAANEVRILKPESVAEMLRSQNTEVLLDFNFKVGLGWMLSTLGTSTLENAGPVAHHGGSIGGFRSQIYLLPDHKLGVVVLGNSSTAERMVDHVATEALKLALEAKTGIQQPPYPQMAWVKRLGVYEITNLENDPKVAERIALTEDHGHLVLEITGVDTPGQTLRKVVSPVSDTEALVLGSLAGAGDTLRSTVVDGEERFSYSGYIVRKK